MLSGGCDGLRSNGTDILSLYTAEYDGHCPCIPMGGVLYASEVLAVD